MRLKFIFVCFGLLFLQTVSAQVTNAALWDMGNNQYGQLGNGTENPTNIPIMIVPTNVTAIAVGPGGGYHTLFLKSDSSLWGVGSDQYGELGDSNFDAGTNKPEEVLATNVTAIAAGLYHSLFIKSDGSLWAMGSDEHGELGDSNYDLSSPYGVSMPEEIVPTNVTAIAAGYYFSMFIKSDGSLWGMGANSSGQLGDGTFGGIDQATNKPEMIEPSGVMAVACGANHTLFLMTNGSLWAMGGDVNGQLGDGLSTPTNLPEMIEPTNVTAIAAGNDFSLYVKSDGSLWGMGANSSGQLGLGSNSTSVSNRTMIEPSGVMAVAAGDQHSLFLMTNGSLWAMGNDTYGELGDGFTTSTNLPEMIEPSNVVAIAAGYYYSVFIAPGVMAPQIEVLNLATVITNGQATAVSFGTVRQGGTGPILNFTVTNAGNATLDLGTPTVIGSSYTVVTNPPATIAAGASGSFSVQLNTGTAGTITNVVSFTNNTTGNNPFTFNVTGVVTPVYTYTVNASPAGGGTVSPGGTNVPAGPITVVATNNAGYAFTNWTSNGVVTVSTTNYTFTLNTNVTLVANFTLLNTNNNTNTFTYTVIAAPAGGGTVSPGGSNAAGSSITVVATNNTGFIFTNWMSNGVVAVATSNYTFTLNTNVTVVANFLPTYTLTVNASPTNGGSVSGGGTFPAGSSRTVTATTNGGFEFLGWSGDATGTNPTLSVTVNTNLTITANFLAVSTNITFTVTTNGAGTVTPNLNGENLKAGSRHTLTATAASGNLFSGWTGSITTNKNPLAIKAESSLVLQANFVTNIFLADKGTYNGLFIMSNVVTEATAGMLKGLAITQKGTYSGSILINGGSHAISGAFSPEGQATNLIKREAGAGGNLTVSMALTSSNSTPQITGTVAESDGVADLTANLAVKTASAEYTLLIMPDTNSLPPTNSPGGDSYAAITNNAGAVKIAGAMADGATLSQTVSVAQDGSIPVYDSLYSGKGLLLGWISLNPTNTADVSLTWIHPPTHTGLYTNGFTNMLLANQILLSQWVNPGSFASLTDLSLFGTIDETNALTNFTVSITDLGKLTGTGISGTITPKTGVWTVTFGSGDIKETGHGALLDATNGDGYFLTKTNGQAIKFGP